MVLIGQLFCWFCLIGLAYIYVGYPLAVWGLSRKFPRPIRKDQFRTSVSVVIVGYNEASRLAAKVAGLLQMNDADCIHEILIGSDGSSDGTAALFQDGADSRVRVIAFSERRGKPAVLNDLIPMCQGEIVLLADVRQEFDPLLLTRLLENFCDPQVGVVSGELTFRRQPGESTAAGGIGLYWTYEKFIRKCESRFRGVPGATGACYAIRQSLFRPIAPQLILDDVAIPMQIVAQGYRCLFESNAVAYDEPSQHSWQEAIRKRRTIAGAAQLVQMYPQWLVPWKNPLWFEFISHKVSRLFSPALLVGALLSNACLISNSAYLVLFAVQAAFYAAGIVGWIYQQRRRRSVVFGGPLMFLALNVTTALALWDAVRSRYRVTWQKSTEWDSAPQSA